MPDDLRPHTEYARGLLFLPATHSELYKVIRQVKIEHAKMLLKTATSAERRRSPGRTY